MNGWSIVTQKNIEFALPACLKSYNHLTFLDGQQFGSGELRVWRSSIIDQGHITAVSLRWPLGALA